MGVLDLLDRLARHRLPPEERHAYDSFRDDIDRHWRPSSPTDRRLDRRSRTVHLATAGVAGGVTLACVGVSGLVTALGAVLLALAPLPPTEWYDTPVPMWAEALMSLGVLVVSIECARFPHRIRRWGFCVALAPLAVGTAACGLLMPVALPPDVGLRAAFVAVGAGALTTMAGVAARVTRLARGGLVVLSVGALAVCLFDGIWVAIYAADHAHLHAAGCAFSAIGALVMASGLLFSRPALHPTG